MKVEVGAGDFATIGDVGAVSFLPPSPHKALANSASAVPASGPVFWYKCASSVLRCSHTGGSPSSSSAAGSPKASVSDTSSPEVSSRLASPINDDVPKRLASPIKDDEETSVNDDDCCFCCCCDPIGSNAACSSDNSSARAAACASA